MGRASVLFACLFLVIHQPAVAEPLVIVGTGDGIPILRAVGAAFATENPGARVLVPPSIHSSGAIREVISGKAVLGRIARPLKDEETSYGILVTPIFRQPAAFFVHPSADVKNLSLAQLTAIYSGALTNWSEVGGPDLRIRVVRREEADSTLGVLRQTLPGWRDLQFLERSKIATTTQDAFDTVEAVEGAIGFGPYSTDLEHRFIVLRLDGQHPTEPRYPSAVTLSLVHREATVTDPALRFVDFVFTPRAQQIVRAHGAVPMSR